MIPIQQTKRVVILPPQLKNNGAFEGNTYFDASGWGHAEVLFIVGTTDVIVGSGGTSTPLFIEECDESGGSYTPVTDAELSAVIGTGDDNKNFAIDIDLTKTHKRYMEVNAPTAGNSVGANLCIEVTLSKPSGQGPRDAAERGLEEVVYA